MLELAGAGLVSLLMIVLLVLYVRQARLVDQLAEHVAAQNAAIFEAATVIDDLRNDVREWQEAWRASIQ